MNVVDPEAHRIRIVSPKKKYTKFTRDWQEWRDAIKVNDNIWERKYRFLLRKGYRHSDAAELAREMVEKFRKRYPFPCLLFGGDREQDKSVGGLVLDGVSTEGDGTEQVLRPVVSNAVESVQIHSHHDETGFNPSPEYAGIDEVLRYLG